ncbi:MAG: helix-turn-helix transcriptional regulator [Alphaproteobacteria bacterium]|nr:helix-turn-helix transcriptional regulator [Alphaproteobacteria bacterium]
MVRQIRKSSRGRTPQGAPNPVDVHVGNRIRLRRTLLGLSQDRLATLLGLTFQQVQKYERGMNRVGASRLWDISKVLETPIGFFFEDMDKSVANQSPRMFTLPEEEINFLEEEEETYTVDPMQKKETLELVKAYYKIPNRKAARHLFDLIIAMSKSANNYSHDDEE